MKVKRTIRSGFALMPANSMSAAKRAHHPVRSSIFSVLPSILSARTPLARSFSGTGSETNSPIRFRSVPRFQFDANATTEIATSEAERSAMKSVISGDVKSLCRKDSWYGFGFAAPLTCRRGVT